MGKIYLVISSRGSYEDYFETTHCAFFNKEDAHKWVNDYNRKLVSWTKQLPMDYKIFLEHLERYDFRDHHTYSHQENEWIVEKRDPNEMIEGYTLEEWRIAENLYYDHDMDEQGEAFIKELEIHSNPIELDQ